jgi:hypothetical protein
MSWEGDPPDQLNWNEPSANKSGKFTVGDRVMMKTKYASEKGIIKSFAHGKEHCAYVVYKCGDNWKDYNSYGSARTRLADLSLGWPHIKLEL